MRGDTIILSDLHLGRSHASLRRAEDLLPLLEGRRHLILNGDVAEVHHPRHRGEAARQTLALLDLCEAHGVSVTLISGNHDPFLSDQRHLLIAGDRMLVTHGDAMHPAIAPWSPAAARMRLTHDEALRRFTPDSRDQLEARLRATQQAAYAEWSTLEALSHEASESSLFAMLCRPDLIVQVLLYWRRFPGLAAQFAQDHRPAAQIIVVGHTHRAGAWQFGSRTVVNTGSFGFPGRPHAVLLNGDHVALHAIRRTRGTLQLATQPRFEITMREAAPQMIQPERKQPITNAAHRHHDAAAAPRHPEHPPASRALP